jgi:hypothetical protein
MVHHVETTGVGEWVGQSVGGGQRDVTFEVQDRRLARDRIARYFSGRLPTADFWISSEYQSIFDCDQRLDRS